MGKLLTGEELRKRAKELGVSEDETYRDGPGNIWISRDSELQRRVMEAERHGRDGRLWVIALVSAIASALSAVAAWIAVASTANH